MRKYNGPESEAARERWIRQGRGLGAGSTYRPWIAVGNFPNNTNSFRIKSLLTGRTHHYFSALEYRHHLLAEYLDPVVDIREQFPLHPISETLVLAQERGIAHPSYAGYTCSITTDFLLTIDDGHVRTLLARSIKTSEELGDPRVQEKLELERLRWAHRNVPWQVLTEIELPPTLEKNLRWMRGWQAARRPPPEQALLHEFMAALRVQDFELPLRVVLDRVAKALFISRMFAIYLFRYAAWHQYFDVDLYAPLQLTRPHLALRSALKDRVDVAKERSA